MPHSGRCLHKTWSQWLKSEGFESVGYEKSMWFKKDGDQQIMLCTHVDDSFVTDAKEYVGMEWERDVERQHEQASC